MKHSTLCLSVALTALASCGDHSSRPEDGYTPPDPVIDPGPPFHPPLVRPVELVDGSILVIVDARRLR